MANFTYKERQISKKIQAVTVCNVLIGHGKITHSPNFIGKYKSKVPMTPINMRNALYFYANECKVIMDQSHSNTHARETDVHCLAL